LASQSGREAAKSPPSKISFPGWRDGVGATKPYLMQGSGIARRMMFESAARADRERLYETRIETDFRMKTATEFSAELFLDGKRVCICRIKMGMPYSENNISYAEGPNTPDGASNEILMC
jgi:hypothetical protein